MLLALLFNNHSLVVELRAGGGEEKSKNLHNLLMQKSVESKIIKENFPETFRQLLREHHTKTPVEREAFKSGGSAVNKDFFSGDMALDDNAGSDMSKWDEARRKKALENRFATSPKTGPSETTPKSEPTEMTPKISPEQYRKGNLGNGRFAF